VTDAGGRFRFVGLTWGTYNLDLTEIGWQSRRIRIDVRSGTTLYVDATLSPQANDQAQAAVNVTDEDVWIGTQFDHFSVQHLSNGRNIWSLLQGQEPSTVTNRQVGRWAAVPALFSRSVLRGLRTSISSTVWM
jgi:hypothetical protein